QHQDFLRAHVVLLLPDRPLISRVVGPRECYTDPAAARRAAHDPRPDKTRMRAQQVVIIEPFKVAVREVELPPPTPNQILVETEASAVSAGTELAVYTGTHQWLKDPNLPDWKFPFRPGYSAAGTVAAVGSAVTGWQPGDRVSYPGNHASHEL